MAVARSFLLFDTCEDSANSEAGGVPWLLILSEGRREEERVGEDDEERIDDALDSELIVAIESNVM